MNTTHNILSKSAKWLFSFLLIFQLYTAHAQTYVIYYSGYDSLKIFNADQATNVKWQEAQTICSNITADDGGWRLPFNNEIGSIYAEQAGGRNFDLVKSYWLQDYNGDSTAKAYDFSSGIYNNVDTTYTNNVRCIKMFSCWVPASLCCDQTIFKGDSVILNASKGSSYAWSPSGDNAQQIKVSPNVTTNYFVNISMCGGNTTQSGIITITVIDSIPYQTYDSDTLYIYPIPDQNGENYTYDDAIQHCKSINQAGHNDWFLPSQYQVVNIVNDYIFSVFYGPNYWSSNKVDDTTAVVLQPGEGYYSNPQNINLLSAALCVRFDSCHVKPVADLGKDTALYPEQPLHLEVSSGTQYNWNFDNGGPYADVSASNQPFTYAVTVTNGLCSATDSINILVKPLPKLVIGIDTLYVYPFVVSDTMKWGSDGLLTHASDTAYGIPNRDSVSYTDQDMNRASYLCQNLMIGSMYDWYVPARDELDLIYQNRTAIADLNITKTYWSSTEVDANTVWAQDFATGSKINNRGKLETTSTLCVRKEICPLPKVNLGADKSICNGDNAMLLAVDATNYKWNTGSISNGIVVTPTQTTTYTVSTTGCGITVTDEIVVKVNNSCVSDIDGNKYVPLNIGNQTWMNANLKTTRYKNGDSIFFVQNSQQWYTYSGAYSWYSDDINNKQLLGAYYNFYAVDDPRGLCPTGWHVPTKNDFDTLAKNIGGDSIAGDKLKQKNSQYWILNTNETEDYGFDAIGSAYRTAGSAYFDGFQYDAFYWTSTPNFSLDAYYARIDYSFKDLAMLTNDKQYGNSVRCVKDVQCVLPVISAGSEINACDTSVINIVTTVFGQDSLNWTSTGTGVFVKQGLNAAYKPSLEDVANGSVLLIVEAMVKECISAFDTVKVTFNIPEIISITKDTAICSGTSINLNVSVSKGTAPYAFTWDQVSTLSNTNTSNPVASPLSNTIYTVVVSDKFGCTATAQTTVLINSLPTPSVSGAVEICQGALTSLTAAGGTAYEWNTGAMVDVITVTPDSDSLFIVTVTNSFGCTLADSVVVVVNPIDTSSFSFTISNLTTVNITAAQTGYDMYWNFNDDNYSNDQNPVNKFANAGVFNVCLTATESTTGCVAYICKDVSIKGGGCNAEFTYSVDTSNNSVAFTNTSSPDMEQFEWTFGNGNLQIDKDASQTYSSEGYYIVTLHAGNTACADDMTQVIFVGDSTNDCEANFIYLVDLTTKEVNFINTSNYNGEASYIWDFGDGQLAATTDAIHQYAKADFYNVCLSVNTTACKNITCKEIKAGEDTIYCNADFSFVIDSIANTISFTDKSFGNPDAWKWNFDDSYSDVNQHVQHTYATEGFYHVILEINNSQTKCKDVQNALIYVSHTNPSKKLKGIFTYFVDTSQQTKGVLPADFKGASYGDAAEVEWDFGDGTKSTSSMSPTHEYAQPGEYIVCMTVYDAQQGISDTYCNTITIGDPTGINDITIDKSDFNVYPNPVRESLVVSLKSLVNTNTPIQITNALGQTVLTQQLNPSTNLN